MYSRLRLARKYLHYFLTASNGKGHGIHSPFVYDFVRNVLNDRREYPPYRRIEGQRRKLLRDRTLLAVEDLGAGSVAIRPGQRAIAEITRHSAKSARLGQLLFRVARHYHAGRILELGTSLGLSTACLASASEDARVLTIEGAPAVAEAAKANFQSLGIRNIEVITGDFDRALPIALDKLGQVDLAFVDGNHRLDPTLSYFNALVARASPSSVLIFDDIHWSHEMEMAWTTIKADPRSMLTVDLFFLGFVFLREEFRIQQDFVVRF
ncbi:MAG: class I SAM-dependent methyltransferase [Bacteroidota bacterium]|nr:class I SAM-dependent methyltransferase [Bacteroidota bacterium]MDP4256945.1 class I SAM-dependent methyltransferase [Bacteroidota bacterium]